MNCPSGCTPKALIKPVYSVEIMEATWVTELRNYWHIIGKETEALLRRDCIKDYMLFNDGFKNDLLETANKRYGMPKKLYYK